MGELRSTERLRRVKKVWPGANYPKMPRPSPDEAVAMPDPNDTSADAADPPSTKPRFTAGWPWVLCVVGLDYLSSLAYQPSVAFTSAGALAPVVTVVVVAVTFGLTVPLYCYIAGRSPRGQGSAGLLEKLIPGWRGKVLVVVLLGFAAADLVFTRTFSAADAAEHLLHSPLDPWRRTLDDAGREFGDAVGHGDGRRLVATFGILLAGSVISLWCRKGVNRGLVRLSAVALTVYLTLTSVVTAAGLAHLADRSDLVEGWWRAARSQTSDPATDLSTVAGWLPLAFAAAILFPKLALGMSGYELALTGMPLVRVGRADDPDRPARRVRRTRFMLVTLAGLMAVYLLSTTFVTAVLIPAEAFATDGLAANRALAYLAHGGAVTSGGELSPAFGPWFGSVYDVATVVVLTLAGVTVLIATRELIPPYLCRLGMEWEWARRVGVMMYLFAAVKFAVTVVYRADVDAQRGAYLTGVLALFTVASFTGFADVLHRRGPGRWGRLVVLGPVFLAAVVTFAASFVSVVWHQPGGLVLALAFVVLLLSTSMVTRFFRSTELRVEGFTFADAESKAMWDDLVRNDYPMLVPLRPNGRGPAVKEGEIRRLHRVPAEFPLVFIRAELGDASEFYQRPLIRVCREGGRVVVDITRCASVPHTLAAAAIEISKAGVVPEVHFGWSAENPLTANLHFVLFGHGNVPWMVYTLIRAADLPADKKPRVLVG
jgi:hypothetical protein